jgi:di/tricarboxylate transporter
MGFDFWFTLFVLFTLSFLLVKEILSSEIAIFVALMALTVAGVIDVNEAFHGFSNVGVLSIALLFVVAGALANTGALKLLNDIALSGKKIGVQKRLARLLLPITAMSAFTNNTPLVAVYIPLVRSWADKYGLSSSKYLLPVSYAAILGGMCTLIGTSTNIIVHGLLLDSGYAGFAFFEISRIGLPLALFGLIYLVFFSNYILPKRKDQTAMVTEKVREYVCALKVTAQYKHIGKTIEQAGLRHLQGLYLFQIERENRRIAPAGPFEFLRKGDRLFFTGLPNTLLELQKSPGLQLVNELDFDLKNYDSDQYKTFEVVISRNSPLVGKRVQNSNFREIYDAVIIAISRSGERIKDKIGNIVLAPGDTLLLLAKKGFFKRWYNSFDFYLISHLNGIASKAVWQARVSLAVFIVMIALTIFNVLPLVLAAGLAALVMVVSKCINMENAKNAVDLKVLITIASAFGIAKAITNSGVADFLANQISVLSSHFGALGAIIGIFVITSIYNMIITSNATAVLIFPIAISVAVSMNVDPRPFAITVAIAAAASFATPISYQTNLMVYGPGGYKFNDFIKIGLPLQIGVGVFAVWLINVYYF